MIYRFNANAIKISAGFLLFRNGQAGPKILNEFLNEFKGPRITKVGGLALPDFRTYFQVTVIKTVWYWHKNKHVD